MTNLPPELVRIVEQACSLTERLATGEISSNPAEDTRVNARLEKWCQTAAQGNLEKFQKRLAWDNINLSTVSRILGHISLSGTQPLPDWVETFQAGIEAAASISIETLERQSSIPRNRVKSEDDNAISTFHPKKPGFLTDVLEPGKAYSFLDAQNPIPFQETFLPFIQVARDKLTPLTGDSYPNLTAAACADLERSLLVSLSSLCSSSMELKFSAFRAKRQSTLSRLLGQIQNSYTKTHYRAFIQQMLQGGGLLAFFQDYPVLARLVATVTDFWVDATGEFIQRLTADWSTIQQTFQPDIELGQVNSINPCKSDPHNQGRAVIEVSFTSGLKLIYKPKDLGLDVAYFNILNWCNQHFIQSPHFPSLQPYKLLKVLNRATYGWVEFVEYLPCQNQAEIKRYYQRAGQLLCLLYVLGANDCHHENLIAWGEHPVLVDLETLMQHPFQEIAGQARKEGAKAVSLAQRQLRDSVIRTGLLPHWHLGSDRRTAYDSSGLAGFGNQETPYQIPKWENINTDRMVLTHETAKMSSQTNAPSLAGIIQAPSEYVNELVDGFEQKYRFLVAHREALLATDGPLAALSHQRVRCLFRSTQVYASVLQKSLHPQYLRDGVDRSIELEVLCRAFLGTDLKHPWWRILKAELQVLEQLDIPYFAADSDSDTLPVVKSEVQCFAQPSYTQMIANIQRLNQDDLAEQVAIIRSSLYLFVAGEVGTAASDIKVRSRHFSARSAAGEVGTATSDIKVRSRHFSARSAAGEVGTATSDIKVRSRHFSARSAKALTTNSKVSGIRVRFDIDSSKWREKSAATSVLDDDISPISEQESVQQAIHIAQDLQRRAIQAADGSATWIGLGFLPQANRFQLQPIGNSLYDGCSGIALFLGALTKITGDNEWRDLCLGALQPLRRILPDSDPESRQQLTRLGIGGAAGLGSIVYSLVRISEFLGDGTLLADAKQAAGLITRDRIAADQQFDLVAGAAGAILGLLTLYQVTADSGILAQATNCGEHLLNHRVISETGCKTWATGAEKPLTGFSHGAAGIAYALLRLYDVTQEVVFRQAAEDAIAYERHLFSPTQGNWLDLRSYALIDGKPTSMTSWCHGAPGIGLARLGSLASLDTPDIRAEIAIALKTTLQFSWQNIDHPCCGNCGRMEVLLVAAQKLLRPDLVEIVKKQANWMVRRAKQVGGFHLFPQFPQDIYNPGFFQGTAGIGYEFLRLAHPDLLPSVLLWN
ncbi:type 2 lanthipeptide synthetase LanM family protein [Coleofasciculus sp. F4-SAH-05]|uniref:type 2 lanthipeptide synthetase LanM family protein n=1 Tax=Coleofasciculus sp. F4-SAH-05 TaxID=3069525 RepID=UPI0032FABA07